VAAIVMLLSGPSVVGSVASPVVLVVVASLSVTPVALPSLAGAFVVLVLVLVVLSVVDASSVLALPSPPQAPAMNKEIQAGKVSLMRRR
jgi:hypothetical protein